MRSGGERVIEDDFHLAEDALPLRLVQPVLRREAQVLRPVERERGDEEGGAPRVEHRVGPRNLGRQDAPRLIGRHRRIGDIDNALEVGGQWGGRPSVC